MGLQTLLELTYLINIYTLPSTKGPNPGLIPVNTITWYWQLLQ